MAKPARSSARDTAASWVTTASHSRPSSSIRSTPASWPWARLIRLMTEPISWGSSSTSGLLVVPGLGGPDLLHVQCADLCDQLLERLGGQGARLGEDQGALLERHQCRDRGDLRRGGDGLLGLGVHRAEDDVGVGLRGTFVDGGELATRTAPG